MAAVKCSGFVDVKLCYYMRGVTGGWNLGRLSRIYKCGGSYTWHAREVVLGGANERLPLGDRYGYQSFAVLLSLVQVNVDGTFKSNI